MATENKPKSSASVTTNSKKRKQRYLPHNKPVKKKGSYPLHPGVQGFFITCDGGREHQAKREAINVIDSFYEELVLGKDSGDNDEDKDEEDGLDENKTGASEAIDAKNENPADEKQESEAEELPAKKKCTETCAPKSVAQEKVEEKSIDKLIEDELKELGDKNKRRFLSLDSGCNGVIFVQMRKIDGDPCPKDIVQHMMTSAASTRKHMSRFILRVLPIEVACYASEEEISRAIAPVVEKYFPVDTQDPQKRLDSEFKLSQEVASCEVETDMSK
ncbi:hypothetical protein OIU77_016969 [Salix suchowensis]|uniref:THUMP domain-containing protein n=1 Tax=Salix suchowensis TaxID=1278906 RepID=A0ABQ8ZM57_9ROSI|nr:hypothetical protein OIU77_016969 [Salix suchowensis]